MSKRKDEIEKLRRIADYQFGKDVGKVLFPSNITLRHSKATGKIRHILLHNKLLATLRARNGLFALTIEGAKRLLKATSRHKVVISDDVKELILRGRDVFAKHVIESSPAIRPGEEVIVTDKRGKVLAVGKALLSGKEMLSFRYGVAVRIRRGLMND